MKYVMGLFESTRRLVMKCMLGYVHAMYACHVAPRRHKYTLLFILLALVLISYLYLNLLTVKFAPGLPHDIKMYKRFKQEKVQCLEQRNFVFIKQMKCATSTLIGTYYRFGYKRNLSFVSPNKQNIYLNWPYPLTKKDFRPSSSVFNILIDHSIYTEDVMESIMPENTVYFSLIRHPFAHVKSVFQYFKLDEVSGMSQHLVPNRFEEYIYNIKMYDTRYKQADGKKRFCIPGNFSLTKNVMSHCFGMPLGFPPGTPDISNNIELIDKYISYIDNKFILIMIVEYLFESLVILRRLMCWNFNDILFVKANVAKYSFDTKINSKRVYDIHTKWSFIDYRLYDHFNNTLWRKISEQSNGFFDEVSALRTIQEKTEKYCHRLYSMGERPFYRYPDWAQNLTIDATPWSPQFTITPNDCWMLGPDPYRLMRVVQRENDFKEAALLKQRNDDGREHRKHQGLC